MTDKCNYCGNPISLLVERCPHCALPGLFPNVRLAEEVEESQELERRYQFAKNDAANRGCQKVMGDFESEASKSQAVINVPVGILNLLVTNDNTIYTTHHQLVMSGMKIPSGSKWEKLRGPSDEVLYPGFGENIRFGALTLDGNGLWHYGECAVILHENLIAHRTSVFEEDSVMFMKHHDIKVWDVITFPRGYRATWPERRKLCVTKVAKKLSTNTEQKEFADLLLKEAKKDEGDIVVEAHIFGPISRRTFAHVRVQLPARKGQRVAIRALAEKLKEVNVELEVI